MTMTYKEMWEEKNIEKLREEMYTTGRQGYITPGDLIQEIRTREQAEQINAQAKQIDKQVKQADTQKKLTWWIFVFTLVVTIATCVQLAIALKWIGE